MSEQVNKPMIHDPAADVDNNRILLSASAIEHVKQTIAKQGHGIGIHFGVKKSGCSGYKYVLDIIDAINANDHVFAIPDTDYIVAVDHNSYPFVRGTRLDFTKQGLNAVFSYDNPNESASCGCGESFSIGDPDDDND